MVIGIDVGGSHIGIGLINSSGKIILKKEKPIVFLKNIDPKQIILENIVSFINKTLEEKSIDKKQIKSIGIAFPGTISGKYVVKAENLGIKNFNIVDEINKKIKIPVFLRNDAKCAAIAEKEYGNLKKYKDSLFLVIGTGVGGAVFLNDKLLIPKRYEGFEVGHMTINKIGQKCNCGKKGCFEVYGSIKKFKDKIKKELNLKTIEGIELKNKIIQKDNLKKIEKIMDKYTEDLAIGISNLINIFEPEVVCIRRRICIL